MENVFIIDEKVKQTVETIAELLITPAAINISYDDIKFILSLPGPALISTGSGIGENRILKACHDALTNPGKEIIIKAANRVIVNITGPMDLLLKEVNDGLDIIREAVSPTTEVIFGVARDINLNNQARVTLLASTTWLAEHVKSV